MALRSTGNFTHGGIIKGQLGHGDNIARALPNLVLSGDAYKVLQQMAHAVVISAKASTVLGKPATLAWPGGVDNDGNRFRASAMDTWLPYNRQDHQPHQDLGA